ncbi:hypothetical protein B0J18DRAFT_290993 [Chaetomium sp. MPI-SDFR-AT-0129]|nr:hypothetical protein B0J18DRAFT_290993 [Chaetomium sp. MPI-SDFR-AT-0129]
MPCFHQFCALCGCQILAAEPTGPVRWNNEFRAVYVRTIRTQDPVAFLTGVGKHTQPGSRTIHAPFDTQMHWSDDKFQPSTTNLISALDQNPVTQTDVPVGFLFHDACWRLFEEACKSRPIPLDRLAQVLISLPIYHRAGPNVLLDWGHNFGGAVTLQPEDYAPWQWHHEPPSPRINGGGAAVFLQNPYRSTSVSAMISETPQQPPVWPTAWRLSRPTYSKEKDPFQVLPMELCMAIAVLLPMPDALRARLASRAFWPVFYNPQFWISRFEPSEPLGHLFEARYRQPRDWRSFHLRANTSVANTSPDLLNRRRIWGLARQLSDIVALRWRDLPAEPPSPWTTNVGIRDRNCRRMVECFTTRRLMCDHKLEYKSQVISIPIQLDKLTIFTCSFGDGEYIVGLSLVANGQSIDLGYASHSHQSVELSRLYGFRVFVGRKGVQALQCMTGPEDTESRWLGSKGEGMETNRVVTTVPIDGMKVGFDSTRMIGLTVYTPSPQPFELGSSLLWHPSIPPQALDLNDTGIFPSGWSSVPPNPVFWCHFGGTGGRDLERLLGITIAYSPQSLFYLEFFFANHLEEESLMLGSTRGTGNREMVTFDIDGPGGERIESVRITHQAPDKVAMSVLTGRVRLVALQIVTNRGQILDLFQAPLPWGDVRVNSVEAAPGTVITGLYGAQSGNKIAALGAMTEPADE